MDKIKCILFSILQKIPGRKNFRRVIYVSLMTAIFILAGCSSSPVPSATATATHEATETSTTTIEPTLTIAPKPDYITTANSVETDNGTVFVKDEDAIIYDTKTGEITEIEDLSTDVTFNTTEDASKIVLALHAAEFADQEQLHKDLTPGETESNFSYAMELNQKAISGGGLTDGLVMEFPGLPAEFIKVKSPTKTIAFPEVGVVMLKQYANPRPVPVILGVFELDGTFHPFFNTLRTKPAATFQQGEYVESLVENNQGWESMVAVLKDRIIEAMPLFARDPANTAPYVPTELPFNAGTIPNSVVGERERLIQLEVKQAGVAYDVHLQVPLPKKQGEYYASLEQLMLAAGNPHYFFISESAYLYTITQ